MRSFQSSLFLVVGTLIGGASCFAPAASSHVRAPEALQRAKADMDDGGADGRRAFLARATGATAAAVIGLSAGGVPAPPAWASGGATAGKNTTIPIAKRRYYGRVQEGVHEFLLMGPAILKADMTDANVQDFFDVTKTVIVEAKRKDVNGQCTKKDGDCKGKEIRDSRYNDMKASMYLLGNAFRINQTKAPDNLPTVQAAKQFFKVMDKMEKAVVKKPKKEDPTSQKLYLEALEILDRYLDLVELPPTESGIYDKSFDTRGGAAARIM